MVAMRIVTRADKEGLRANFVHAPDYRIDRVLRAWAFVRNKSIGKTQENKITVGIEAELADGLSCLLFSQPPQPVFWMRRLAVCEPVPSVTMTTWVGRFSARASAISPPHARLSSSGCGAMTIRPPLPRHSFSVEKAKVCAASRSWPAFNLAPQIRNGSLLLKHPRSRAGEGMIRPRLS